MPAIAPYLRYPRDVAAGKITAGLFVRQCCERHLRDLKDGKERGLRFDKTAAERALGFFRFLKHSKGEWAGTEFKLEPWQQFLIASLFGWMRADGTRRFRTAYIEIARKNGKSTILAGVGLYLFFGDREPGAEVYAAATTRPQAKIVFGEAKRMVEASPELRRRIGIGVGNLNVAELASKFEPVSSDYGTLDGLNVHGAIVDELHAHRDRGVWDVLETASGSRRQPMRLAITTAGFDKESVCWELRGYGLKVIDPENDTHDDSFFSYVAAIDDDDDWTDEANWPKANPNWGVSVKPDVLRDEARKAMSTPSAQNAFRRLHLNQWTEQESRWLDMADWNACGQVPIDPDELRGRTCFAGLDLSSTKDVTALVLYFPPEDDEDPGQVLCYFWVPAENVEKRARNDRVPYPAWIAEGHLEVTPGNVVDYDFIRAKVNELAGMFQILEVAYDPWNATQLAIQLQADGATMVPIRQGWQSMTAPSKELEKLVLARKIAHGGNPVLKWMASNVAVLQDPAGNVKPDKKRSREKIDGIVALVMAIARAMLKAPEADDYGDGTGLFVVG